MGSRDSSTNMQLIRQTRTCHVPPARRGWSYFFLLSFVPLTVGACLTSLADEPRAAVTMRWYPPCSVEALEPFFKVDIFEDGRVRFTGSEQTREQEENTTQINRAEVNGLVAKARRYVRNQSRSRSVRRSDDDSGCLVVSVGSITRHSQGESEAAQAFVQAFIEATDTARWVCPERVAAFYVQPSKSIKQSRFCWFAKYPNEAIGFALFDRTACINYSVDVYFDVIHYSATTQVTANGQQGSPIAILSEQYFSIGMSQFDELVDVVKQLNLKRPIVETTAPLTRAGDYGTSAPEDIERFKNVLDRMVNIDWVSMPEGGATCGSYGNNGFIKLATDLHQSKKD